MPRSPTEYSNALTAVVDARPATTPIAFRQIVLERFDMSLGTGLGKLKGSVFRIGHLGDFNDLMLAGTLCGVEMGLCGPARRAAHTLDRRQSTLAAHDCRSTSESTTCRCD